MNRCRQALCYCDKWLLLSALAILFASPHTTVAQQPGSPANGATSSSLNGPWRFHAGDDPRWADPIFDDSTWPAVLLDKPLSEQGIPTYSGYGWYRIRLVVPAGAAPQKLLVTGNWVGQVAIYLNGRPRGNTRGMTSRPTTYASPPFAVDLPSSTSGGTVLVAVRTWADVPIQRGLLARVELGSPETIGDKLTLARIRSWDDEALTSIFAGFLFFCVAVLGATLFVAQRNHLEYLWLSILCLTVAIRGFLAADFAVGWVSLRWDQLLDLWIAWLFTASTLEFVLRFTGARRKLLVRIAQATALIVPISHMLRRQAVLTYSELAVEVAFTALIVFLLLEAWRRGRAEAGVMLLPFFLAGSADSLETLINFAIEQRWLPARLTPHAFYLGPVRYSISTVAFLIFLASLISVILYRFIRVSEIEQRSAAEIEAARSVQALLIPTRLPSNRHFLLESAYLPANGVGGDFFQVLPLQDDSMLLVVGDVSGKGLQAAMNASTLVGALRNENSHDPATVLKHLNQVMVGQASGAVAAFATCLCARVYPDGRMTIANAGHLSPYRDGREMEIANGLPLGMVPGLDYDEATVTLARGDRLIFLSDGIVEATDPKGELFGFERTQQVSHESARYIAQTAQRFGQNDDITVVSLYFVPV